MIDSTIANAHPQTRITSSILEDGGFFPHTTNNAKTLQNFSERFFLSFYPSPIQRQSSENKEHKNKPPILEHTFQRD
jgi:hypothetical protein